MTIAQQKWPIVLIDPHRLRRHEEHDTAHADTLHNVIVAAGVWTTPIIVEWEDLIVMDGHHRLSVACAAGLSHVPCLMADYQSVRVESRRAEFDVTPHDIRQRARTGLLYPPKTTRHHIPSEWNSCCAVELAVLRKISVPNYALAHDHLPKSEGRHVG
ncbi:ParB N-terminal domain-containing protein [Thalassospira sp. GB04J01]|uniref:ParB N-terminal domain-containing protein n=1 Tax=Thalassospira sp. GB04J01 TaxID=1485225 RepID=UPI000C9ABF3B|nr:ParB N-terminal domain-containing protein [Thalassospira sp. GB04J01]|tara:strand:- start:5695 stop:6168 length:474 start_codon:yes stop_codon:yes gene_type:complete